jgi:uncharacterized membrane protein YfcA
MPLESLPLALLLWLACVILLAGLLQGALGFGFPFVATPLVAMVTDMRTAIIIVLLPTVATICVALFTSGPLRATLARFWMMPLYMVPGSAAVFAPLSGITAGIFEGTANIAAPPLIIFYLSLGVTPAMLVQALNICFLVGKTTQFTVLATRGGVGMDEWLATLPFVAIGVAGALIGVRIRNRIDAAAFRLWVKRALLVIALGLLAQYGYSLVA